MEIDLSCIEIKTSCSVIPVLNYWQEWFATLTEARRLAVVKMNAQQVARTPQSTNLHIYKCLTLCEFKPLILEREPLRF